jgi:hypothetical protein
MVALNEDALRLLRRAVTSGALERTRALEFTGRIDLTRTAAEDLADRLATHGLLERRELERRRGKPVVFIPTQLGQAIARFIDEHLVAGDSAVSRPTIVLLDEDDRTLLETHDLELFDVLTRAAVDIACVRQRDGT